MEPAHYIPKPPARKPDDPDALDLFGDLDAPAEPTPTPDDERAERDRVLEQHEHARHALLTKLRAAALAVWELEHRPVSANDVRHLLAKEGFAGDKRVLGQLFHRAEWTHVGTTLTSCEHATIARVGRSRGAIGEYVPTSALEWYQRRSA